MQTDDAAQRRFENIADGELAQLKICYEDGGQEAVKDLISAKIAAIFGFLVRDVEMEPIAAYLTMRLNVEQLGVLALRTKRKPGESK